MRTVVADLEVHGGQDMRVEASESDHAPGDTAPSLSPSASTIRADVSQNACRVALSISSYYLFNPSYHCHQTGATQPNSPLALSLFLKDAGQFDDGVGAQMSSG